jgi:hypothetical protein
MLSTYTQSSAHLTLTSYVWNYLINKWVNWVNQHITNPYPSLYVTCTTWRKCHHTLFSSDKLHHSKPMWIYSHTLSDSYVYSNCNCATWVGIWFNLNPIWLMWYCYNPYHSVCITPCWSINHLSHILKSQSFIPGSMPTWICSLVLKLFNLQMC